MGKKLEQLIGFYPVQTVFFKTEKNCLINYSIKNKNNNGVENCLNETLALQLQGGSPSNIDKYTFV